MKRIVVGSISAALVATMFIAAPAGAAEVVRTHFYRTGAWVSTHEIRDGLWINLDLGAAAEATLPNGERAPDFSFMQEAYVYDAVNDTTGDFVWARYGSTYDVALTIPSDLSSAMIDAPSMPVEQCDAQWTCSTLDLPVTVQLDGAGPLLRSRQNSVSAVHGESRFVAHGLGVSRRATATVSIGGDTYGPTTDPFSANIYDTRDSYLEMTLVPFNATGFVAPMSVNPYDTEAPGVGHQAGQGVAASWVRSEDGITVATFVSGSSRHLVGNGAIVDETLAFVYEQVYWTDEWENTVTLSETFTVEGASADSVFVDNALRTGGFVGNGMPAVTCTYPEPGADPICTDTTISAAIDFAGYGDVARTMDGNVAGVAGYWMWAYRRSSTTRQATATGTVDGFDPGTLDAAQIDLFKQGFRTVTIR